MDQFLFIVRSFKLLRQYNPWRLFLVFLLTLFMGFTSGFSLVLLIPLLQLLNIGDGQEADGPALFFQTLAEKTGISLTIGNVLLVYVILLSLTSLLQYWKSMLDTGYQQNFICQLRRRLFRKIIMADWTILNSRSKNNHLQVLTHEVPNLINYYYFYLRLLTTLILAASYIIYALMVSAKFTGIIIATGVLLFFLLRKFLFRSFRLGEGYVDSYNRLLKYIDDFWHTVKIAKVHGSENFYSGKFDQASNSLLDLEYRMQRNYSLPQLIYRVSGILVLVFVVYFGYHAGNVPVTSFFILILLFSRIFPQFVEITTDVNMIISHEASVKMVLKLDEEFPDVVAREKPAAIPLPLEHEIRMEGLRFAYRGGVRLFDDFSETIPVRRITGIIGESGIGKTTLIDIIAGLQKPEAGCIMVNNRLLDDDLLDGWRAGIGYLPQDPFFIDGTIRENLTWDSPGHISDQEIWKTLEQVNAAHLAKRYDNGLDTRVVNYQFVFSGGECQRLALARVLLRKPHLLLLDEATSSLDPENEIMVMETLVRLKEKVTVVFVTHRISLMPYFDKVIRL